jgi:Trypsin-co-occurring domain 2
MPSDAGDLANAIAALRADLESGISEGRGKDVQFGLGDIELTLQLVATKHAGGKIGWSVLGVDAGGQSERTHAVKLTLKPLRRAADGTYRTDFVIADQTADDPGIGHTRT